MRSFRTALLAAACVAAAAASPHTVETLAAAASVGGQQVRFDDVVRNLRNPDPKARLDSVRLLRDAKYPEAIVPMAPLVLDPVDDIQLEAIAAEVSFFVDQDIKSRRMVGFVLEKRNPLVAATAFDLGPLALVPRTSPPELITSLLQAIDDGNPRVRLEAMYAVGVVARPPLASDETALLIKALDHFDPGVRAAAARVIGRLKVDQAADPLVKAINDSHADVRYSAMLALGAIRATRAVSPLGQQFEYYKKGEGAWSALEALAEIASPASVPVFEAHIDDNDPSVRRAAIEGLGRTGDASQLDTIQKLATTDDAPMVRLAASFAMQKLGRDYTSRIVDQMNDEKIVLQAQEYLLELGPSVVPLLAPRLQDPDVGVRVAVAELLGTLGNESTISALKAATADANGSVAEAAKRAIQKIQLRR
jgi:HEAT repeat protein